MNKAQKGIVGFVGAVTVTWGALVAGPAVAQAIPPGPNSCVSGGGGFIGGGYYEATCGRMDRSGTAGGVSVRSPGAVAAGAFATDSRFPRQPTTIRTRHAPA